MARSKRPALATDPAVWRYSAGTSDEDDFPTCTTRAPLPEVCDHCLMKPDEIIEPWGIRCGCWLWGRPSHACDCGPRDA